MLIYFYKLLTRQLEYNQVRSSRIDCCNILRDASQVPDDWPHESLCMKSDIHAWMMNPSSCRKEIPWHRCFDCHIYYLRITANAGMHWVRYPIILIIKFDFCRVVIREIHVKNVLELGYQLNAMQDTDDCRNILGIKETDTRNVQFTSWWSIGEV